MGEYSAPNLAFLDDNFLTKKNSPTILQQPKFKRRQFSPPPGHDVTYFQTRDRKAMYKGCSTEACKCIARAHQTDAADGYD